MRVTCYNTWPWEITKWHVWRVVSCTTCWVKLFLWTFHVQSFSKTTCDNLGKIYHSKLKSSERGRGRKEKELWLFSLITSLLLSISLCSISSVKTKKANEKGMSRKLRRDLGKKLTERKRTCGSGRDDTWSASMMAIWTLSGSVWKKLNYLLFYPFFPEPFYTVKRMILSISLILCFTFNEFEVAARVKLVIWFLENPIQN